MDKNVGGVKFNEAENFENRCADKRYGNAYRFCEDTKVC
jgi:hypothetical protein